ncbi:putative pectate lyase [Helianthus annuus]|nr:putative pectate lyase [Helianthus annuus]KAJ0795678.1 putative pectate lyase [Helianthus annuus]
MGGKGGQIFIVLDPSDGDPENPQPGTLRPLSATQKPLMGVGPSCTSLGKGALCKDGLVDIPEGSTAVTVTNSYFTEHDKVMLLGHSDDYLADAGMQVTVAFNHFGKGLVERMPRCHWWECGSHY